MSKSASKPDTAKKNEGKRGREVKTTCGQVSAMIEWLEVPTNFRLITGAAQKDVKTVTAGAKLKKIDAYRGIADNVDEKCCTKWYCQDGQSRYDDNDEENDDDGDEGAEDD